MTQLAAPPTPPVPPVSPFKTVADLLYQLGDVPPQRVLLDPWPGTATEADVIRYVDGDDKHLVELIDGTLVEKPMGQYEARVGGMLYRLLDEYAECHDLGVCYPADATLRVLPRQVRLPDASFVPWAKLPNRELPDEAVAALVPDLAAEVLSESNTRQEMERKRRDY